MPDMGYDDLDDDLDQEDQSGGNGTIKAIRKAQREAVARAKQAEAELAELRAWKTEQEATARKAQVSSIAVELGLTPKQAGLVPNDLEATKEAVAAWAVGHDLLRQESAPQEAAPTFFTPVTGPGGVAPDLKMSLAEFQALYANEATRPKAVAAFQAGRVEGLTPPTE